MPLVRFKIRNELSLGGPEIQRSAAVEDEEPKAILGAVEVAGLIGILRQLGDLAEFSAEVFNGLQEEVTVTASRCQKLTSRVRRIESALSPLEKAVLSQTSHIHFAYTAGSEWHPRIRNGHSHFVQSDLPLCVMESYEQCRDPPPLHLLDRFSVGGPGSCLRKYSDPTFFRKELSNTSKTDDIKVQRDQAHRKRKKKRLPQRNICRSNAVSTSDETNGAHLSNLTDDRQTTSQSTSTVDMPRSSNMQDLSDTVDQSHLQGQSDAQEQSEAQVQSDFQESSKARDSITGSGYIEYVINQSPVNEPEVKLVEGFLSGSLQPVDRIGSAVPAGCIEVVDDNILYNPSEDLHVPCASIVCDEKKETLESMVVEKSSEDDEPSEIHESKFGPVTPDRVRQNQRDFDRTYILFDEVDIVGEKQSKSQANNINGTLGTENEGENKSEHESEADEFVDARNTIESESESDMDGVPKPKLEHYFGDISTYCSEDANSDNDDGSEDIQYEEMAHDPRHENSEDESCSGSYLPEDSNVSCYMSDPVCEKTLSHDENSQKPWEFFASCPSLLAEKAFPDVTILREEPVAAHHVLAGDGANEKISSKEPIFPYPCLKDSIPAEKILPEEHLVNYPSLAEAIPQLPEEEISQEETADATHTSEAVSDEEISAEVSDSTNLSLEEALPQEQISLEEFVGINQCLAEAVPDERFLLEKPFETYSSLAELQKEKILHEEADDGMRTCLSEAFTDEQISPKVLDSKNSPVAEAVPHEQTTLEYFVGRDPCLVEAVHDERVFPEEQVTSCIYLTNVVPIEEILPEEPLDACASLGKLPKDKISQEKSDEATHPSCAKAESHENVSLQVLDSTNLSVAVAISHEQTTLDEFVGVDPYLGEAVLDERGLPEELDTTCLSLTKAAPLETIFPEERPEVYPSLEELPEEKISQEEEADDATHPYFSEAVCDEKILPLEDPGSEAPGSTTETGTQNKTFTEEPFATDISLNEAVFDEKIPGSEASSSTTETGPHNKTFTEEPFATENSLNEANFDEKIPGSEAPGSATETGPQNKTFPEEPVATYISLNKSVFDVKIPSSVSTTETGPHNKTFPEEPATDLSLVKAVFDERIPAPEASSSTTETGPHNKTFPGEPVATTLSSTEPVFEEKIPDSGTPSSSTTEPDSHNKTFLEEPVPNENNLPKEPAAAYLALAEGIPDQKVFLDDAALLLFAEAIFDQKFSPEVPDSTYPSLKEPEMHVAAPSLVTDLPAKNIKVKEGEVHNEPYTASDVSMNQKSGLLEPESTERTIPSTGGTVSLSPETQKSLPSGTSVESISIWSNGGLLGLAPLKPPVFAEPNSVSQHIQNEINEASVLSTRKREASSRSVENTEKSSLPLVVSDPTSQQHSNMSSLSHMQSTGTSFRVFGLSHRLLMAGFRGNSSSTCKFESVPSSSYDTGVAAIEDKTRKTPGGSSFEEQLDYESSLFGSPTSSPPVEHMKISFNTIEASPVPKLKLRIPCQPRYNGENADMFPSFQLVPEASNSEDDDDNSDTFCQSSPCASDNYLSNSELWESDESPRKSVSSLKQIEERSRHGDMGSFSGSFLDLPCYDAVDHQSTSSRLEQEQVPEHKPSVSEIIRHWPPNQPKSSPSNEANLDANTVLKKKQDQSLGLVATDDDGES
ncbi:unnamed protein product [Arabidopsis arenosa]|uniref:Protein SCAR n=1 Tax=Arabidopsis arenosa TaxID=38785 RepID=A0A8S2B2K0_ARAAE|nr:unnamed protein product [Arabidopsis arenosa]